MPGRRRLAAIMFTDVVGFTRQAQVHEAGALARLRELEGIVRPTIAASGGRVVKSLGDGHLVEFLSAVQATECALAIQAKVRARNEAATDEPILLRIGIHAGDVEESSGDILGDAVNVASRLVALAEPGGICLSEQVTDHIRHKVEAVLERLPPRVVRGVLEPVNLYRVVVPGVGREPPPLRAELPRLAVLPLANISSDPRDAYIADGLTEELISTLSQLRGMRVIARTSVGRYKDSTKPVVQIAQELGVHAVLEGSVRKAGDELRITLQLIDGRTEEHRWAQTFDRPFANVFAIQAEVAERTAGALRVELVPVEREAVSTPSTRQLTAYEHYLRGVRAARRFTSSEGAHKLMDVEAVRDFEAAIREDPDFAAARSALANHYLGSAGITRTDREAYPLARSHVLRALELNPRLADARTARGNLAMQSEHDWSSAEAEFRRALEVNPSSSAAHFWYGSLLVTVQRYREASDHLSAAVEVDPLWFAPRATFILVNLLMGEWNVAVLRAEQLRESYRVEPPLASDALRYLAWVYAYVGRRADAERVDRTAGVPADPSARWNRALLWAWLGKTRGLKDQVRAAARTSREDARRPLRLVQALALLGRTGEALDRLEQGVAHGDVSLWAHYQAPYFDPIRDDSRFTDLLARLRLPTSQTWHRAAIGPASSRT